MVSPLVTGELDGTGFLAHSFQFFVILTGRACRSRNEQVQWGCRLLISEVKLAGLCQPVARNLHVDELLVNGQTLRDIRLELESFVAFRLYKV